MRLILFIARVALICNICSLFTIIILFQDYVGNNAAVSSIIIVGYVLAMVFNPLTNLITLGLLLFRRDLFRRLPKWLVILNFIFLLLQLQYIIFLNGRIDN
jgi:hypothetical protein